MLADIVAKVARELLARNNGIRATGFLNQHCALATDLEYVAAVLFWADTGAKRFCAFERAILFESKPARGELLEIRDSSLYAPRDFDISPYFMVIKPTLAETFDYKRMDWVDLQVQSPARANATSDVTDTMFQESQASDGLSGRRRALR